MSQMIGRRVGLRSDTNMKQSMDRLGDDLCQHLLSYLSLEDRFRCECVSKQWQRLIYTTVTEITHEDLDSNELTITEKTLDSILKKCQNVKTLVVNRKHNPWLDSITKRCTHLNAIHMTLNDSVSVESIERFFRHFGRQLSAVNVLVLTENDDLMSTTSAGLKRCPNISRLIVNECENGINVLRLLCGDNGNEVSFARLQKIHIYFDTENVNHFETFAKSYRNTVKAIDVFVDDFNTDDKCIDILMTGLSRMSALVDLKVTFKPDFSVFLNHLKQIGVNCLNLKSVSLVIDIDSNENLSELMKTINENLKQLKRLQISGNFPEEFALTSESLHRLKRLTHLTINTPKNDDLFLVGIDRHLPALQSLHIRYAKITKPALNSLSRLPKLQTIIMCDITGYTSKTVVQRLNDMCPKLRSITIKQRNPKWELINSKLDQLLAYLQALPDGDGGEGEGVA